MHRRREERAQPVHCLSFHSRRSEVLPPGSTGGSTAYRSLLAGDCDVPWQILSSRRGSEVEEREERLPEGHIVVRCER